VAQQYFVNNNILLREDWAMYMPQCSMARGLGGFSQRWHTSCIYPEIIQEDDFRLGDKRAGERHIV
jgi:hypothetical protein